MLSFIVIFLEDAHDGAFLSLNEYSLFLFREHLGMENKLL